MDSEGRIVAWAAALARLTGIEQEEAEGARLCDVFARLCPEEEAGRREAVEQTVTDALRTGETGWLEHVISGRLVVTGNAVVAADVMVSSLKTDGGYALGLTFRSLAAGASSLPGRDAAEEVLRQLYRRLEAEREQERQRISRELHDELGHTLTALKMEVVRVYEKLAVDPGARGDLMRLAGFIDEAIETVRRISTELRPGMLDDLGLPAALEWQVEEFSERTGIEANVQIFPPDLHVNAECAIGLFRILQEALTNVARHSQATSVEVTLRSDDMHVELIVSDNGKGIDREAAHHRSSQGLIGMRERARQFHGTAYIKGVPGEGTTVHVRLPCDTREDRDEKS